MGRLQVSTLVTNNLTNNLPHTGRWVRTQAFTGYGCARGSQSHHASPTACVAWRPGLMPLSCTT